MYYYGSESWTITKDLERKLQSFHRRCARTIFGVTMFHVEKYHIKTETVLEEINLLPINGYIARRNLAWFGKVMRMPFNRLPRKLISCWVPCPRPCSRLAVWADTVLKYMEIAGIDIDNWGTHARDEAAWCDTIGTTYKPPRYAKGLNPTAQEFIPQQLRYLPDRPLDNTPRTTAKIQVYTQNSLFSHAKIRFLELALQTPPECSCWQHADFGCFGHL